MEYIDSHSLVVVFISSILLILITKIGLPVAMPSCLAKWSFFGILDAEVVSMSETSSQTFCCKVAVFSDIHSNYHAFRACFEDAKRHGAEQFIFLGDYVSDLANPCQCLDLVYEIQ